MYTNRFWLVSAFLLAFQVSALASSQPYPFVVNFDSSAVPQPALNQGPIGSDQEIYARDGHFYTMGADKSATADDHRIRFWGINLTPPMTFPPTPTDAELLATRFERMGINIVRIHALDAVKNPQDQDKTLLSTDSQDPYPTLNAGNLAKFFDLINAFRNHGIYIALPVKLAYRHPFGNCNGTSCIPDLAAGDTDPGTDSPMEYFNAEMLQRQEQFYDLLLSRINPGYGEGSLTLGHDPVLAMLEINNENSLIERVNDSTSADAARIPLAFRDELDNLWNDWLYDKYATLGQPFDWDPESGQGGDTGFINGEFSTAGSCDLPGWALNPNSTCSNDVFTNTYGNASIDNGALKLQITNPPSTWWNFFIGQSQLQVSEDQDYLIRFRAWADAARKITINLNALTPGGLAMNSVVMDVDTGTQTDIKEICFTALKSDINARLTLIPNISNALAQQGTGSIWFDDVEFRRNTGVSVSYDPNVALPRPLTGDCPAPTLKSRQDYLRFLRNTEGDYYARMLAKLRLLTGGNRPVTGSQANYGGLAGSRLMSELMDYMDIHFYWDNPKRTAAKYDMLQNIPMVEHAADGVISAIVEGRARMAGQNPKPLTITEYGDSALNQYAEESFPIIAAYAALQDLDAVMVFNYYVTGSNPWDDISPTYIRHLHTTIAEPRREALMHLAANLFRRGDIQSARSLVEIHLSEDEIQDQVLSTTSGMRNARYWFADTGNVQDAEGDAFDTRIALTSKFSIVHDDAHSGAQPDDFPSTVTNPYVSDTGELIWNEASNTSARVTIDTARTKVITGYLTGTTQLQDLAVTSSGDPQQFGTLSLTSMDGAPVHTAADLVVTSISQAINEYMDFVDAGNNLVSQCGTDLTQTTNASGATVDGYCAEPYYNHTLAGDVVVTPNPVTLDLATVAYALDAYRLDGSGNVTGTVPVIDHGGSYSINLGAPGNDTPWFRLAATVAPARELAFSGAVSITGDPAHNFINGNEVILGSAGTVTLDIPASIPDGDYHINLRGHAVEAGASAELAAGGITGLKNVYLSESHDAAPQQYALTDAPVTIDSRNRTLTLTFSNPEVNAERSVHLDRIALYATGKISTAGDETTKWGTVVAGDYHSTLVADGSMEAIQEERRNNRTRLRHEWTISGLTDGVSNLYIKACRTANTENDDFQVQYSTTSGQFVDAMLISADFDSVTGTCQAGTGYQRHLLANTGSVTTIRLIDTNQANYNTQKDTVFIDHMFIRTQ